MRTTVDLPDVVYRQLKVRAGLTGTSLKQLLLRYVAEGLRSAPAPDSSRRRSPPPLVVPARGRPIRALTPRQVRRLQEAEDESRVG